MNRVRPADGFDGTAFAGLGLIASFLAAVTVHAGHPVGALLVLVSIPFYCLAVDRAWEAVE